VPLRLEQIRDAFREPVLPASGPGLQPLLRRRDRPLARRRPSPRAPGTSSRTGLFVSRFLLSLLVAFPAGFVSSLLYEPAFKLANGLVSPGSPVVEHAMVDKVDATWFLDSPYWEAKFRWQVADQASVPADLTAGSVAKITLRRGLLGARWIESIEYSVLK